MSIFFERRTIWWPRPLGWMAISMLLGSPIFLWWYLGEQFLATTRRAPADVLVVEGWIGFEGVEFARHEFAEGGYRYIVATGGQTESRWTTERWNYADETFKYLVRLGIPSEKIIAARSLDDNSQRTFHSAVAVRAALARQNVQAKSINVVTLGPHCRRSRLVFYKAMGAGTPVGVVCWIPSSYTSQAWWRSSERAADMIKETVGYVFELLLNSGRTSNAPPQAVAGDRP